MRFPDVGALRKIANMHSATINAFTEELLSIQKEAGLRDLLKRGTKPLKQGVDRVGMKTLLATDKVFDRARKLPVVGKKLKGVNLGHALEASIRLLA